MMTDTHSILIPDYHPPRLNQIRGRHWAVERRAKKELAELLRVYSLLQGVPTAVSRRQVKLALSGWPQGKFPDRDAWDKCLLDALVHASLLLDDSDRGLEGRVEVVYHRSERRWTQIELTDV